MGLKDNLKAVKNELNTEEQFIENFIKGERFIRKYKFYISAVVIILVAFFLCFSVFFGGIVHFPFYACAIVNVERIRELVMIYPIQRILLFKILDTNLAPL